MPTTHLGGLLYGSGKINTANKIRAKYLKMQEYADNYLSDYFTNCHLMFWSPVVRPGVKKNWKKLKVLS